MIFVIDRENKKRGFGIAIAYRLTKPLTPQCDIRTGGGEASESVSVVCLGSGFFIWIEHKIISRTRMELTYFKHKSITHQMTIILIFGYYTPHQSQETIMAMHVAVIYAYPTWTGTNHSRSLTKD
ncbi:MAG: hypothetical protein EBT30_09140 [Verrucomicrobia bacterium]|nr:hypothetical protein [Verrucomicrobiota bacterium]